MLVFANFAGGEGTRPAGRAAHCRKPLEFSPRSGRRLPAQAPLPGEPSLSLRNRLEAALAYLQENPETVAIVSGGQGPGEQISEAEAMRVWLEARGVAPARIRMETQAASTAENLRFSLALIAQAGDGQASVAVCSSEYHLCRARALAREAGVEVYGVAGRTTLPLLRLNYFVREGLAMLWLWAW